MPHYARPVPRPAAKQGASPPAGARAQPDRAAPRRGAMWHMLQLKAAEAAARAPAPRAPERAGLPASLKAGVESLSGIAMDDVRVHRNSPEPARLGAHAFARGADIHLGPGQERHLPHEAWHVVQQKQGRVRATAQMKNFAFSDDGALEREADAMGARALLAPGAASAFGAREGAAPRAPSPGAGGQGVVQAKLVRNGHEVTIAWYEWGSVAAHRLVADARTYELRDDSQVTGNVLHVLRSDRKYLLGEQHGDGTWAQRTAHWSTVDTMHEAYKDLPEKAAAGRGRDQTLESLHAYTVQVATIAQTQFHHAVRFHAHWLRSGLGKPNVRAVTAESLLGYLKVGRKYLDQARAAAGLYMQFFHQYRNVRTPQQTVAWTLSSMFELFDMEMRELREQVDEWIVDLDVRGGDALNLGMAPLGEDLQGRSVFEDIVTNVLEAIKPETDVDRLLELASVAGPADRADKMEDSVRAAFALRESAMIANIKAARAPLLVQLGDHHVDRVDAAIAETVRVRKGVNFETITREEG